MMTVPTSQGNSQKFHVQCPLCGEGFEFGYIAENYDQTQRRDFEEKTRIEREKKRQNELREETRSSNVGGPGSITPGGDREAPKDQRSDVMNPNNPTFRSDETNRSNQLNPNNPAYRSSRGGRRE